MTHALGYRTCNLSINVPKEERTVLGQAAFASGKSVSAFLKGLIEKGLESENAEAAVRLREVRRRYYGSLMLAIFAAALAFGERLELRRTRVRVEEVREEVS